MPELPEVETIVRSLKNGARHGGLTAIGQKVRDAQILWNRTIAEPSISQFNKRIIDQTIEAVARRGKFLVFTLSEDTLLMHLRMSGDLRVEKSVDGNGKAIPVHKHDRLVLRFESSLRLAFNNPRKFGRVWLLKNPQKVLSLLGPEPMDAALTGERFHVMLQGRKRQLKPLLMDQHFLAGIGNIYADEALFRASLHPRSGSNTLTKSQSINLLKQIRRVLEQGIRRNGASIDWVYRGGDFQNDFKVYGRAGEPCPRCGVAIQRIVVSQRGTHICPHCQTNNARC